NAALLTAIFFFTSVLISHFGGRLVKSLGRVAFLALFLRALNGVRVQYESLGTHALRLWFGRFGFLLIGLLMLCSLIFVIWHFGLDRITRAAMAVSVVLAPFGLLASGQAAWQLLRYRSLWQEHRAGSLTAASRVNGDRLNRNESPRILWLIFDEMDESV